MNLFKQIVRLRIAANLALAIFMLWRPETFISALDFDEISGEEWVQALAIFYIFITFAYLPSAIAPSRTPYNNLFPILAPIIPAILLFWLGGGFVWLAIYEVLFLIALNWSFQRDATAALMARP